MLQLIKIERRLFDVSFIFVLREAKELQVIQLALIRAVKR